jgi:hypothetical protein
MPSKSAKQARFMAAAAHDSGFAKRAGIPMGVAKEYNDADAGRPARRGVKRNKKTRMFK